MTGPLNDPVNDPLNDDELMARVRAAFDDLDPVPERILAAGRSALRWRAPSAALAERVLDRTVRAAEGVRGGPVRALTFTCPGLTVELEVTGAGRNREITGRLVPPAPALVQVRHADLGTEAPAAGVDATGLFCLPDVPAGLVSLVLSRPDGTTVVTSWIRL